MQSINPGIVKIKMNPSGQRVESGRLEFQNDWPGIFLRGDDAIRLQLLINIALDKLKDDPINQLQLQGFSQILGECLV